MRSEASIEIDRPIEEVFEVTIRRVTDWSIIVVEDEVVEEKPEMVGTRFRTITEERGHRMEFDGVVILHQAPTAHTVEMRGKQFDIEAAYRFEDLGGRTRVTVKSRVTAHGFTKVMFALMGWAMKRSGCKAQAKELESLKRLVESGQTAG